MAAKIVKRLVQEMAKSDNDQDEAERYKSFASAQTKNDKRSGDEFHEWNHNADKPKQPHRQKGIRKR